MDHWYGRLSSSLKLKKGQNILIFKHLQVTNFHFLGDLFSMCKNYPVFDLDEDEAHFVALQNERYEQIKCFVVFFFNFPTAPPPVKNPSRTSSKQTLFNLSMKWLKNIIPFRILSGICEGQLPNIVQYSLYITNFKGDMEIRSLCGNFVVRKSLW